MGGIDISALRVSLPNLPNDFKDAYSYFEEMLVMEYGEDRFKKALKVLEQFNGDIYTQEKKALDML